MDQSFHESTKLEPEKLLEHFWFFSNVMSKTQSNREIMKPGRSYEDTFELVNKAKDDEPRQSSLTHASSLPPLVDIINGSKLNPENEETIQDEESEFRMGKLIRQASLGNSETFVPRQSHIVDKGLRARSRIISRHGSITKLELGTLRAPHKLISSQGPMGQLKALKSFNDLEFMYKESTEDIKAKIKFWARAVASNVGLES